MNRHDDEMVPIITSNEYRRLHVKSIQFVEQRGRKIHVVTTTNKEYVFYGAIEDIAALLVGAGFYRALKGLVINFDMVEMMTRNEIVFISGISYGVGRNNMIKIRKAYKNYVLGNAPFGESLIGNGMVLAEDAEIDEKEN